MCILRLVLCYHLEAYDTKHQPNSRDLVYNLNYQIHTCYSAVTKGVENQFFQNRTAIRMQITFLESACTTVPHEFLHHSI